MSGINLIKCHLLRGKNNDRRTAKMYEKYQKNKKGDVEL